MSQNMPVQRNDRDLLFYGVNALPLRSTLKSRLFPSSSVAVTHSASPIPFPFHSSAGKPMAKTSDQSPTVDSLPSLIPQLPDDITIQCIVRLPQSIHPTLALVSRSWRSLLNSPILFTLRSHLGISRRFICFNVRLSGSERYKWYLLDRDPESPRPLLHLPPPPIPTVCSSCAALGPTIFIIGGYLDGIRSPAVQIFDARINQWSIGPPMAVARVHAAVGAIAGKIYAIGGDTDVPPSDSWAEVLDPGLGFWTSVPSPADVQEKRVIAGSVFGGKLYMLASPEGGVVLDLEAEPAWSDILTTKYLGLQGRAVVVDGILYTLSWGGKISGYDLDQSEDNWMPLHVRDTEVWDRELMEPLDLANVGGKLCVVSEKWSAGNANKIELMFAGIEVSRNGIWGLWGSLVWTKSLLLAENGSSVNLCTELEL